MTENQQEYELPLNSTLPTNTPLLVKLSIDKHHFTERIYENHLTNFVDDSLLKDVMCDVARSVMKKFNATCSFTQQYEFALFFNAKQSENINMNVEQLHHALSTFASNEFAFYFKYAVRRLNNKTDNKHQKIKVEQLTQFIPAFQVRVLPLPNDPEYLHAIFLHEFHQVTFD